MQIEEREKRIFNIKLTRKEVELQRDLSPKFLRFGRSSDLFSHYNFNTTLYTEESNNLMVEHMIP